MNEIDLRSLALQLAVKHSQIGDDVIAEAQRYYDFLMGSNSPAGTTGWQPELRAVNK